MALDFFSQGFTTTNSISLEFGYDNEFTYAVRVYITGTGISYDSGIIPAKEYYNDSPFAEGLSPSTTYTYTLTVRRNSNQAFIGQRTINATTQAPPPPSTPTGVYASNITQTSVTLNWNASENATSYTVYLNGSEIDNTSGTSYTFSGLSAGTSYSLSVRANGPGGSSGFFTVTATTQALPQYTYTINYNANGGSGFISPTTITTTNTSASLPVEANEDRFTRPGFGFQSWNTNSSGTGNTYFPGNTITLTTSTPSITLYARWQALAPGFDDQTVAPSLPINKNINTSADNRVLATNVDQYSLISAGGVFPSWLSISNSGFLSGSTNAVGTYSFRVRATNSSSGQFVDSNVISIVVFHPGKKATSSSTFSEIGSAKRFDGTNWVNLTIMKKWSGTSWVDISN